MRVIFFFYFFYSLGAINAQSRIRIDQTNYWVMFESDDQRCRNLITNELISGAVYLETLNGNPELEFNFKDGLRDGIQLTWFKMESSIQNIIMSMELNMVIAKPGMKMEIYIS